jgi:hypothetical protein
LTVDGVSFAITSDTRFKVRGNGNADSGDFEVGDSVLVRGMWNGDKWFALEVKLSGGADVNPGNGGGNGGGNDGGSNDGPDIDARFSGAIEAMSAGSLTVGDQTVTLNAQTKWYIAGELQGDASGFELGDMITVKAEQQGEAWVAVKVLLISHGDDGGSGGGGGGDDDGGLPLIITLAGSIEAASDTSIKLYDKNYSLNSQTMLFINGEVVSDFSLLDPGDKVQLTARLDGDHWVALQILFLSEGDPIVVDSEFSGTVSALSATSITVGGKTFTINADTEIELEGGLLLSIGDEVKVMAHESGSAWIASKITLVSDGDDGLGGLI